MQLGGPMSVRNENMHKISMFNAQLEHLKASNNLFDKTTNVIHPSPCYQKKTLLMYSTTIKK